MTEITLENLQEFLNVTKKLVQFSKWCESADNKEDFDLYFACLVLWYNELQKLSTIKVTPLLEGISVNKESPLYKACLRWGYF